MHHLLASNSMPIRCVPNCTGIVPESTDAFAGPATIDAEKGFVYKNPVYNGVNFCPIIFHWGGAVNVTPWYTGLEAQPNAENYMDYAFFTPRVKVLIHEMAHTAEVSREQLSKCFGYPQISCCYLQYILKQ